MSDKADKPTHVIESFSGRKLSINGKVLAKDVELTEREVEILNKHPMAQKREVKLRPIAASRPSTAPTNSPS